jgi:hypothetical protein
MTMASDEFVKLVQQMRDAQKRWFKYRDIEVLSKCKQLEREVDRAIERENWQGATPSLFDRLEG